MSNPALDALRRHVSGKDAAAAIVAIPATYFAAWSIGGVVQIKTTPGADFDSTYDLYCENPLGFGPCDLARADFRGVMSGEELTRALNT